MQNYGPLFLLCHSLLVSLALTLGPFSVGIIYAPFMFIPHFMWLIINFSLYPTVRGIHLTAWYKAYRFLAHSYRIPSLLDIMKGRAYEKMLLHNFIKKYTGPSS
uniref:ABC-2 type transporter domain-containing protein n=1 Tax=Micrurus spixii TaxID=129469 RepID=A0A2D4NJ53_9SAUR